MVIDATGKFDLSSTLRNDDIYSPSTVVFIDLPRIALDLRFSIDSLPPASFGER